MDIKEIIAKLHPLERKVLPILKAQTELNAICKAAKLKEIEVTRALQWLESKGAISVKVDKEEIINLDVNGLAYRNNGLPEKVFLCVLNDEFKGLNVATKKSRLSREEVNVSLGHLKKKGHIETIKGNEGMLQVKITAEGKRNLPLKTKEEIFLSQDFPIHLSKIKDREIFQELKKRKEILKVKEEKTVTVSLTGLGQKLVELDLKQEVINRLNSEMLQTGEWKNKIFRAYEVEMNPPRIYAGKKHFISEAVSYIKQIWLEMGFQEMNGNYVQSAFWDLDALFVPQDHPAREMQDTFYLNGTAKLPELWKKIKSVHETGGDTGSKGWGGKFSKEEAEKILLRTHTTVLSAQTLAKIKKEDLPAKFFAVGKVFRNEALDWKHLFEFDQVEGIVIDPKANLTHLKGYLQQFYNKMGYDKVRMRPAHFPYTEPSLEIDVFHPIRKEWVELGGAGILRPEVVKPLLGFDCPVLAWGQGMGRIISEYWNITDIRELHHNDIKQLREARLWLK
ncbi:MAG TPA: phenylalanine--tRNA ligase subunit alpha [Candidatus Nanoarchaeia archaeon]|nr:phenylalanine--tRNA ligase subunit alpha [Candidatus Nanoarchaeia archaeon]